MIKLRSLLRVLVLLFILLPALNTQAYSRETANNKSVKDNNSLTPITADASTSTSSDGLRIVEPTPHKSGIAEINGGHHVLQISFLYNLSSFTQHLMCKGDNVIWRERLRLIPIAPTTVFSPSDVKAECLTTVYISSTIEFRWYYRNSSAKSWVSCFNYTGQVFAQGEYDMVGFLNIAGYWPAYNYPRAYKVDVYLDGLSAPSFSEFFEVTSGGLNSPRMCEGVDAYGSPTNITSRFTLGKDAEACHYSRFDRISYFNDQNGFCHNFTTVWTQPNGSVYRVYSGNFSDYKDASLGSDFWESKYVSDDLISIDSNTPFGDWKVEVYLDSYFNETWMQYGPVATTHFVVGGGSVADWTFMVYLDGDNNLEAACIDIFMKLAQTGSSPDVNVVVQMDRHPGSDVGLGYDDRFGNWTDCKRFSMTKGMWPTSGNETQDLGEVDMGDPDTLWSFVNWTVNNYPAKYYSLALFDHGTGCMGICYDLTNASDYLSLPELAEALVGLPALVDVLLLDACSMAMIEIAYQVEDCANVLVAPEGLGWAPAPYDSYLLTLTNNPFVMPGDFAKQIGGEYINWCMPIQEINNATMSATDLTKVTALRMALTDFSVKLNETEEVYHEQISLARNMTEQYPGPFGGQSGYYADLYRFSQLAYQYVSDLDARNAAERVMNALESVIIFEGDKALPASHGLAVLFPYKGNYDYFNSFFKEAYLEMALAKDTPWDEFFMYYLNLERNGCQLTIQTPYFDISVIFNEEVYTTDVNGKLRLFVMPGSYTVEVPSMVSRGSGSRGIFTGWNDYEKNPSRTIPLSNPPGTYTYWASYKTQYEIAFEKSGIGLDYEGTTLTIDEANYTASALPVSFWWNESTFHSFAYRSPLQVSAEIKQYVWNFTTGLSSLKTGQITVSSPGSIIGYYKTQFHLTVVTNPVNVTSPSGKGWYYNGTDASISASEFLDIIPSSSRYRFNNWTIDDATKVANPASHSTTVRIDESKTVTANYLIECYLAITSTYGSPSPTSGWFKSGTLITASVASPLSGQTGTRYLCDGWTGTGSVDASGTAASINFTLNEPSTITWNWKIQYLLTVSTDPIGLTPEPAIYPVGPWYNEGITVSLTARQIEGRAFDHWTTDGATWDRDVNSISFTMDGPRDAIAHYVRASSWWDIITSSENMQIILGILGTVITVGLVGTAWIRTRHGRTTVKNFLAQVDDIRVRRKDNPAKCEEELFELRNTVLEGVTDGKITQEGYEIINAKIDKCLEELHKK